MFWGGFAGLVLLFFVFTASNFYVDYIFQPVVEAFAWAGSGVLNLLGQGTTARAEVVSSSFFSINISKGCDGLAPIALLVSGILIYPSKWKYKWPALIAGPAILIFLNLIRIISLFLIGAYVPKLFDVMHVEVWQAIFIIIAVVLWLIWLNWVMKKLKAEKAAVSTDS
ncbi:MAG: archaeosortase/exosortase family protein [Bacteroidota bacterium]